MNQTNILNIAFINIKVQTGLPLSKQVQIEDFIRNNRIDILHLQESNINDETFSNCSFISSGYNLIVNNSRNKYGTASLVKNELEIENIAMDSEGRIIIFEVGGMVGSL